MPRIRVPVQMRWADLDAYGHVNNAAMFTLLEEARIATFWSAGAEEPTGAKILTGGPGADSRIFVARQEIEYLAPLEYSQGTIDVQLWVGRVGGASLDVCYELHGPDGTLCARAESSIVVVDAATGRPRRLTGVERAALEPLSDEPIVFRRRG